MIIHALPAVRRHGIAHMYTERTVSIRKRIVVLAMMVIGGGSALLGSPGVAEAAGCTFDQQAACSAFCLASQHVATSCSPSRCNCG